MNDMHSSSPSAILSPAEILAFWFDDEHRKLWFRSTPEFDAEIHERFFAIWQKARDASLPDWNDSADGALALVLVLDQFPLNMFRGQWQLTP